MDLDLIGSTPSKSETERETETEGAFYCCYLCQRDLTIIMVFIHGEAPP